MECSRSSWNHGVDSGRTFDQICVPVPNILTLVWTLRECFLPINLPIIQPTDKREGSQILTMKIPTMKQSDHRLDGKVALVTGAGRGLGAAFAIQLAQAGADVVVNYANSSSNAEAVVKEIESLGGRAVAIKADISQVSQISALFEAAIKHFSHLDIVVSNAGKELFSAEEETTEEMYDSVFQLNTRAQFFIGAHALKYCRGKPADNGE